MIGVINLDKPVGPTSHDMVGLVRRLTAMSRIGHAGTLDPLASGVLPILVGGATRLSEELTGGRKRYEAVVRLGYRSETDDSQGPIKAGSVPPDVEAVREALTGFVGTFDQAPPTYSARKQGGVTAHRAARKGAPVALEPRTVTVHELHLTDTVAGDDWLDVSLAMETGPGTYVRSIARDLGERLGCGGYLRSLRRTAAAGLAAADARTPAELEALASEGRLAEALIPVEQLLDLPVLALDEEQARRFANGGEVAWSVIDAPLDERVLVRDETGLLGLGAVTDGTLRPRKVLDRS